MEKFRLLTSWVTLASFLGGLNGPVWAEQSGTTPTGTTGTQVANSIMNVVNNAVPMLPQAQMNLQDPTAIIQSAMAKCEEGLGDKILQGAQSSVVRTSAASLLNGGKVKDVVAGGAKNATATFDCGKLKDPKVKLEGLTLDESACRSSCGEESSDVLSCSSYYGSPANKKLGNERIENQISEVNKFKKYFKYRADNCSKKEKEDLEKQQKAFQCQQDVLANAVSMAASQLQNALQKNQENFGKMLQYQNEVGDQIRQIDEILGPEDKELANAGGDQFKGLLGIQKSLNEKLAQMNGNEAKFKSQTDEIQKRTDSNEQTLESERMGEVAKCMRGERSLGVSGGRSLTCYRPVMVPTKEGGGVPKTDAAGKVVYSKQPCGPLEFVRSQVTQSAFITSRGVMRSQARTEESEANSAQYDAFAEAVMRDLGLGDEQAKDGGRLVTRESTWQDISKKYANEMSELSQKTGVNIEQQMNVVAGRCFGDADVWKKQQKRSSSSRYNTAKAEIQKEKNGLNAELRNGLAELNQKYGETMAVLSGQVVSVNRFNCTADDPAKMQACYVQMKDNLTNLLEGNGASFTSKEIKGGTAKPPLNVPGFSVPCKGVNGCVTTFQQVRKAKKEQLVLAQKQTSTFVTDGNAAIKTQLSGYAAFLGGLQRSVVARFGALAQTMGVSGTPKFLEAEALKQGVGPEPQKAPGPFENPSNMGKVLSSMVQPSGLINFSDNGMKEMMDSAKEKLASKAEADAKRLQSFKDITKELAEKQDSCNKEGSERVGQADCSSSCYARARECAKSSDIIKDFDEALSKMAVTDAHGVTHTDGAVVSAALSKLSGYDCEGTDECRSCINSKKTAIDSGASKSESNSGRAGGS